MNKIKFKEVYGMYMQNARGKGYLTEKKLDKDGNGTIRLFESKEDIFKTIEDDKLDKCLCRIDTFAITEEEWKLHFEKHKSNVKIKLSIEEIKEKGIEHYVYDNGWYEYKINDKWTLCNSDKEIVVEGVDTCNAYCNYYEYKIDNKWYEKNFDGSDHKKEESKEK